MLHPMWPPRTDRFFVTFELVHGREQCECLPLAAIFLVLQESDQPSTSADIGLDGQEALHAHDLAGEVHSRDTRSSEFAAGVEVDSVQADALRCLLEEGRHLIGAIERVVIPGKAQLITPVGLLEEELLQTGKVAVLQNVVERSGPFFSDLLDVYRLGRICFWIIRRRQMV